MTQNLNVMLEQLEQVQNKIKEARVDQKAKEKVKDTAKREAIVKARSIMRQYQISPQELAS